MHTTRKQLIEPHATKLFFQSNMFNIYILGPSQGTHLLKTKGCHCATGTGTPGTDWSFFNPMLDGKPQNTPSFDRSDASWICLASIGSVLHRCAVLMTDRKSRSDRLHTTPCDSMNEHAFIALRSNSWTSTLRSCTGPPGLTP